MGAYGRLALGQRPGPAKYRTSRRLAMKRVVECVPNFSEGRRQGVIDRIVEAMVQVPGAQVLDVQSDPDHNRSVVTLLGEPDQVAEAAYQAVALAAELIDLDHHRGGHPRMGATDVVPFVPVQGVVMDDCVALARKLGKRVGEDLGIPVYLYEAAATVPGRKNLAQVRGGEYEGLREAIVSDPGRAPDFGPARMGTAGATAIGARGYITSPPTSTSINSLSPKALKSRGSASPITALKKPL